MAIEIGNQEIIKILKEKKAVQTNKTSTNC